MSRPSRYPQRRPPAVDVAASMAMQMPAPDLELAPDPGPAGAFPGLPEAQAGTRDTERAKLLSRITGARFHHRHLVEMIIQVEGLSCFTTEALTRMVAVLDVIEVREDE